MDRPKLGRWELYKAAQEQVVKWLIQTAGNAVDCKLTLKARQLLDLARAVANSAAAVPRAIVSLLQDVIDGRQAQANWHSQRSNAKDNENHQWFIELLIEVRDTLLPFVGSSQQPEAKEQAADTQSVKAHLVNVFSLLAVEEPSASPLGSQPAKKKKNKKKPVRTTSPKLEDDGMDADFALWCHIKDMDDVRGFLKQAWIQHAAGALSIVLVSQLTEVGIGLMRLENNKFVARYPEFQDWWAILKYLGLEVHGSGKTIFVNPASKNSTAEARRDEDLVELICPAAAMLLQETRDKIRNLANTAEGQAMLRDVKDGRIRFLKILTLEACDFHSILNMQASELLSWIIDFRERENRPSTQTLDRMEFLCGMADYYDAEALPTWLVMACAIHIDLYEIIGDQPGVAAKAWLDNSQRMKKQLDEACDQLSTLRHPATRWKEELDPIFQWSDAWKDILFVTKKSLGRTFGQSPHDTMIGKPTSAVMGSPCLAGAFLFGDRMAYHKLGIRFANSDLSVFALANLYTAIIQSGLLKPAWEDMHFLISTYKATTPLVPINLGTYDAGAFLRQYLLSLGLSITQAWNYTSRGVPTPRFVMRNHRRALAPTSEYVVAVTESFHANELLGTFDRGDLVETVLTKLTAKSKGSKQEKKRTRPQPQFTLKEVLSTFKAHMIADGPHLNFDYIGFHMLGEKIRRALHDLFSECKDHPIRLVLWEIVFRILRDVINAPRGHSLLRKAAVILGDIIGTPGASDHFSKEAHSASSSGVPGELFNDMD